MLSSFNQYKNLVGTSAVILNLHPDISSCSPTIDALLFLICGLDVNIGTKVESNYKLNKISQILFNFAYDHALQVSAFVNPKTSACSQCSQLTLQRWEDEVALSAFVVNTKM